MAGTNLARSVPRFWLESSKRLWGPSCQAMERSFSAERRSPPDSSRLLHQVIEKTKLLFTFLFLVASHRQRSVQVSLPPTSTNSPKLGTAAPFPLPQCDLRLVKPHLNPFIPHGWRLAPPYPWLGCLLKRYLCHQCPFHVQENGGGGWVGY